MPFRIFDSLATRGDWFSVLAEGNRILQELKLDWAVDLRPLTDAIKAAADVNEMKDERDDGPAYLFDWTRQIMLVGIPDHQAEEISDPAHFADRVVDYLTSAIADAGEQSGEENSKDVVETGDKTISEEISMHFIKVYAAFCAKPESWLTNRDVTVRVTGVAHRTVRAHSKKLVKLGLIEQRDVFGGYRYRLRDVRSDEQQKIHSSLSDAAAVLGVYL